MITWGLSRAVGSPVRIGLFDPYGEVRHRQNGILAGITDTEVFLEMIDVPADLPEEGRLQVEVFSATGLLRYHSCWWGISGSPRRVVTALPEQLEVVERRRATRVYAAMPTLVQRVGGHPITGQTVNLSANGIAFIAPLRAEPGEELEIRLTEGPAPIFLPLLGRVVRTGPGPNRNRVFALQFIGLPAETRAALAAYVDYLQQQQPDQKVRTQQVSP